MSKVENVEDLPEDIWMLQPCEVYLDEYRECKSFGGRFHQRYTTGRRADCSKWKETYNYCMEFRKTGSIKVAKNLLANEVERRNERLAAARANDIWQYRTSPPADWNKPLPEHLDKMKLPEVKDKSICVIL
ncbi:hypothetical protein LSH36_532g03004 [Paralvinella palmiformis]|uniref:Synaptic plasticity regulator PANTS n=1 Tax=Paralvinella palmiformis TaxID=53620 RepID=A0AAD9J8T4_9ANNE|nr:hypothetical protein LSH36_532g03004 [Paralvinella palmiformis]